MLSCCGSEHKVLSGQFLKRHRARHAPLGTFSFCPGSAAPACQSSARSSLRPHLPAPAPRGPPDRGLPLQLRAEGEGTPSSEGEEAGGAEERGGAAPFTQNQHRLHVQMFTLCPLQVPQFKAQLLPDFSTVVLPEKKKLDPTKPEPFKLLIDERGALKNSRWEEMVPHRFWSGQLRVMGVCSDPWTLSCRSKRSRNSRRRQRCSKPGPTQSPTKSRSDPRRRADKPWVRPGTKCPTQPGQTERLVKLDRTRTSRWALNHRTAKSERRCSDM